MRYKVKLKARCKKAIGKMPKAERLTLAKLIDDLMATGPVQPSYRNYSNWENGSIIAI